MALTRQEINKNFYKRRKENGLCQKCGNKLDREGYYCSVCLEKVREYEKETRDFCRKNHICTECRKERVYGSDKICFECRAKKNNRRAKTTDEQRQKSNERFREQQNHLYEQRVEQGICTRCGKRSAADGKKKCVVCLKKDAEAHRRKNFDKINTKEYRKENHLCYFCGGEIEDNTVNACSSCRSRQRERYEKANESKSECKNKYWKAQNRLIFEKH